MFGVEHFHGLRSDPRTAGVASGKKIAFSVMLILGLWIVFEVLAFVGLRGLYWKDREKHKLAPVGTGEFLLPTQVQVLRDTLAGEHRFLKFHPELGWEPEPGARTELAHLNALGARSTHEHAPNPKPGKLRLAAFGDSFTFCADSADADCWSARLEDLCDTEVLNFGVPGYAPDQALLRFRDKSPLFKADVYLLGIMNENILRVVNQYRPALYRVTSVPLTKPRFVLDEEGGLELRPNILRSEAEIVRLLNQDEALIGRIEDEETFPLPPWRRKWLDFLPSVRLLRLAAYQVDRLRHEQAIVKSSIYNPSSSAFAVLVAIAEAFVEEVEARGASPILVLWPDSGALLAQRETGQLPYGALREILEGRGVEVWDLAEAFDRYGRDRPVISFFSGHYNRSGNEIAAFGMRDELCRSRGVCTAGACAP